MFYFKGDFLLLNSFVLFINSCWMFSFLPFGCDKFIFAVFFSSFCSVYKPTFAILFLPLDVINLSSSYFFSLWVSQTCLRYTFSPFGCYKPTFATLFLPYQGGVSSLWENIGWDTSLIREGDPKGGGFVIVSGRCDNIKEVWQCQGDLKQYQKDLKQYYGGISRYMASNFEYKKTPRLKNGV